MNAITVRRDLPSGAINDDLTSGVEEAIIIIIIKIIIKTQPLCVLTVLMGLHTTFAVLPPHPVDPPIYRHCASFLFCFLPFSFCIMSHSEQALTLPCMSRSVQTVLVMTPTQTKVRHGNVFIFTFNLFACGFLHFLPRPVHKSVWKKMDLAKCSEESEREQQHRKT